MIDFYLYRVIRNRDTLPLNIPKTYIDNKRQINKIAHFEFDICNANCVIFLVFCYIRCV